MGNFMKQQEARKEVKEKDKVRREKLAGYSGHYIISLDCK